jgi:hypothetical protein
MKIKIKETDLIELETENDSDEALIRYFDGKYFLMIEKSGELQTRKDILKIYEEENQKEN